MFDGVLGLLVGFLLLANPGQQASQGDVRLQATSLVLKEGIRGGFVGPTRHRTVLLAFDWNRHAFRAVEERRDRSTYPLSLHYRAVDLEAERYQRLIARVTELGLAELPLEDPPGGTDLYARNIGIRFHRDGATWENKASEGCEYIESAVQITAEQRGRFDAVVALVNQMLAELPLAPASALDLWSPRDWRESEVRALSRALDFLGATGRAHELNLNAVEIEVEIVGSTLTGHHLRFPARNAQSFLSSAVHFPPPGSLELLVRPGVGRVEFVREIPLEPESAEDTARRRTFVETHPELTRSQRDLILAGWLEEGMSEAMVLAAWGPPRSREVSGDSTQLGYRRRAVPESDPLGTPVTLKLFQGLLAAW